MNDHAKGAEPPDFSYLIPRFQSFHQFTDLVGMLRGAGVENETNRRWSSRFLFPFGTNAVYEDVIIDKHGEARRDYINFGRTGELLYLMLSRSQCAHQLRAMIRSLLRREATAGTGSSLFSSLVGTSIRSRGGTVTCLIANTRRLIALGKTGSACSNSTYPASTPSRTW